MKQKSTYESYILAFGPHPDDVEVGCGGVLKKSSDAGKRNIIVDMSASEMSTHGNSQTRVEESRKAAEVLGVNTRDNLLLCDTCIVDNPETRKRIAVEIRKYKPEIILMPRSKDRHPDHEMAADLVKNAVFYAGLKRLDLDGLAVHKPRLLLHYMIRQECEPDIIIPLDVGTFNAKMKAITTYESQKNTNSRGLEYLEARHIVHGHSIGEKYGEGFKLYSHSVGVESFDQVTSGFF